MEACIWMALAATFGTWLVTALGAATVVFFSSPKEKTLNLMLGFSAGVMIAASFWSLLEPAIAQAESLPGLPAWLVATAGFLIGALFLWGSDKLVSRALGQVEAGGKKRVILLVLSITLHNIPEGLAVGVAFGALQNGHSPEALMGAVSVQPEQKLSRRPGLGLGGTDGRGSGGMAGYLCPAAAALCPVLCGRSHDSGSRSRADSGMSEKPSGTALFCHHGHYSGLCGHDAFGCHVGLIDFPDVSGYTKA